MKEVVEVIAYSGWYVNVLYFKPILSHSCLFVVCCVSNVSNVCRNTLHSIKGKLFCILVGILFGGYIFFVHIYFSYTHIFFVHIFFVHISCVHNSITTKYYYH